MSCIFIEFREIVSKKRLQIRNSENRGRPGGVLGRPGGVPGGSGGGPGRAPGGLGRSRTRF